MAAALVFGYVQFARRTYAMRDVRAYGPGWSFPSRVYSAALPIVEGSMTPRPYVLGELQARGYRRTGSRRAPPGTYAEIANGLVIGLRGFMDARDPEGNGGPELVEIQWNAGWIASVRRLGGYRGAAFPDLSKPPRIEPELISMVYDERRVRRTWVPLSRIPQVVRDAVIAAEDRRFRRHGGLDLRSNARALFVNMRAGGIREGGSTLTQQLARALFLESSRTLSRKLSEAGLAVALELALSKDEILEMYLNAVYWGQDGSEGVAGIAEAARFFFDLPVESLQLEQAALLAGIIPAPNALSPFRSPALAHKARARALRDMVDVGVLDPNVATRVTTQPLGLRRGHPPAIRFPAFADAVREELARTLEPGAAEHLGLGVMTTLDPAWQAESEVLMRSTLIDLDRRLGSRGVPLQAAFVALDPHTGSVRAMVGGRDVRTGDFNRATQARRQPGSAIKPIVYAAALDPQRGPPEFTPASTVPDLRRSFPTSKEPWSPRNDDGDYHAAVTLAKALAKSLNVATANLVENITPAAAARAIERFGLGRAKPVPSIGLGTHEVTLLALTAAYAPFVNEGRRTDPTMVRAAVDVKGRPLPLPQPAVTRVVPAETAALMTGLLEDVVIFGVSYPLRTTYGFTRPVAGKTGTTNDFRDAWFIGFTPDLVAGVWVGYDQPRSLGAPASRMAIPVWARLMSRMLEGFPPREFDSDRTLHLVWIDPFSGGLARSDCPRPMRVPFLPGTAPREPCAQDHTQDWARIYAQAAAESAAAAPPVVAEQDSAAAEPPPESAPAPVPAPE